MIDPGQTLRNQLDVTRILIVCLSTLFVIGKGLTQPIDPTESQDISWPNPQDALIELESEAEDAAKASQVFRKAQSEIGLDAFVQGDRSDKRYRVLDSVLPLQLEQIASIDDERIREHFGDPNQNPPLKWELEHERSSAYSTFPFYISTDPNNSSRIILSSKLLALPKSTKLFYVNFIKAMGSLPSDLSPSALKYGLATLLASDIPTKSSATSIPDFEIEAAIAALLFRTNEEIIWDLYPQNEGAFDSDHYYGLIRSALVTLGSSNPEEALQKLKSSPDEYYRITRQTDEESSTDDLPYIPPISAGMQLLWHILPANEVDLRSMIGSHISKIQNPTYRLILLNGAYDKMSAIIGKRQLASTEDQLLFDPTTLIRHHLKTGELRSLTNRFESERNSAIELLEKDLTNRSHSRNLSEISFDPALVKWCFRFLYNYSTQIRRAELDWKDSSVEENLTDDSQSNDTNKITSDLIQTWWLSDSVISRFFANVGQPKLTLYELEKEKSGKILDCRWLLNRARLNDSETIAIQIVDPFAAPGIKPLPDPELTQEPPTQTVPDPTSPQIAKAEDDKDSDGDKTTGKDSSGTGPEGTGAGPGAGSGGKVAGGGPPVPGVYGEAKVMVRTNLTATPKLLDLSEIKRNYEILTVDRLDFSDPTQIESSWARVTEVAKQESTGTYAFRSGASSDLETGRIQYVYAKSSYSYWHWISAESLGLKSGHWNLLGVQAGNSQNDPFKFHSRRIQQVLPTDNPATLYSIKISFREIEKLRESGSSSWGYFADERLVQCAVEKALEGVDGMAFVETPDGLQQLDQATEGAYVNAFHPRNPKTFVDLVTDRVSKSVDYYIALEYSLNGDNKRIQVAEGQRLIAFKNNSLSLKKAYQLKVNDKLASGFNEDGSVVYATLTNIQGVEGHLGVYGLKLKQVPLVRANGLLIPVQTETSYVVPGIEENSLIQMGTSVSAIRDSKEFQVDLTEAPLTPAKEVHKTNPILSHCTELKPRFFWNTNLSDSERHNNTRYIEIVTPYSTLQCGHLQEIYVTHTDRPHGWESLNLRQASEIKPGSFLVYLQPHPEQLNTVSSPSPFVDQPQLLPPTATPTQPAIIQEALEAGSLQLVPVKSVYEMHPTEKRSSFNFLEFIVDSNRITQEGLRPTMFANGIMVNVRYAFAGGKKGQGLGNAGPNPAPVKIASEKKRTGRDQLSYHGTIKDVQSTPRKLRFSETELRFFEESQRRLESRLLQTRPTSTTPNHSLVVKFLKNYFEGTNVSEVYSRHKSGEFAKDYLEARSLFIQTGDTRFLPAVVNSYLFLAGLFYASSDIKNGDELTNDFLSVVVRVLNKDQTPKLYTDRDYLLRDSLLVTRDFLTFLRKKESSANFDSVTTTTFPADDSIKQIESSFVGERELSADIIQRGGVNLYNLCRQLDKWAYRTPGNPFESLVAPSFNSSSLFESGEYQKRLRTKL